MWCFAQADHLFAIRAYRWPQSPAVPGGQCRTSGVNGDEGNRTPLDKDQNTSLNPGLALIQEGWPKLPEHIKAAIMALVQTHGGRKTGVHHA